MEGEKRGPEI